MNMLTGHEGMARSASLAASIEMTPKQVLDSAELPDLFPAGVSVYVADLAGTDDTTLVSAARRLKDLGYNPVPHLAARRMTSRFALEARIAALAGEAGVSDMLIVGGGLAKPLGEFPDTLSVLDTGVLDRHGISRLGVAGHPEGSPDFPEQVAAEVLRLKQAFSVRTGASMRIVTQFGFNPEKAIHWASSLGGSGVGLPVHLGVAGPAKVTTLLKYAVMCGVGNSIDFLRKRALSLAGLATNQSPEILVAPIEEHWRRDPNSAISQIHVFPFGGIRNAADWLETRGSWTRKGHV